MPYEKYFLHQIGLKKGSEGVVVNIMFLLRQLLLCCAAEIQWCGAAILNNLFCLKEFSIMCNFFLNNLELDFSDIDPSAKSILGSRVDWLRNTGGN